MTSQREQTVWDPWSYQQSVGMSGGMRDLVGFEVEAIDGEIGDIDAAAYDARSGYVVVDTWPWIFGNKVMLPAGTITRVDRLDRKVYVGRTKEEINNAPRFDEDTYTSRDYRDRVGDYYRRFRY